MISRAQSGCWRACGAERGASVARAPQSLQRDEAPRGLKCEVLSVEKKLATGAPRPMARCAGVPARVSRRLCVCRARVPSRPSSVSSVERRSPRPRASARSGSRRPQSRPQPREPQPPIRCSAWAQHYILPETLLPYNTHARPSWHSHLKHVGSARRSLLSEPRRAHRTAADAPRTSATRAPLSIAKASVPV